MPEQQSNQPSNQPKRPSLNDISDEEIERIKGASTAGQISVDNEWMLLAEFAKAFGWEAYKDARDDNISSLEMMTLIEANRKLEAQDYYRLASSSYFGAISATQKKPGAAFTKMTKHITKQMKVQ